MGLKRNSIRSLFPSIIRWRRSGLASVLLLFLTANALPQEKTRIVVVYGDSPSSVVISALFQAWGKDLPGMIDEYDLRLDTVGNVIFIAEKQSPYVKKALQTSRLLSEIPFGQQVEASTLDSETQAALTALTDRVFALTERSHVPKSMIMSAQAIYKIKFDGKEMRIGVPFKTKDGGSPRLNDLLQNPTTTRPVSRDKKSTVVDDSELRLVVRASRHSPETLAAISDYFKILSEEEERVRQDLKKVIEPLIRNLEELNKNEFPSGMPNGKQSLEQLTPKMRERLHDSFLQRFRANGFSSEDQAEIAWSSVELADSGVEFMLFYATSGESGDPKLRAIEITMAGK